MSNLFNIARSAGLGPYIDRWSFSNPTKAAASLSAGKTHYFDPDTLRYFHSRVCRITIAAHGLALITLESASADMHNTRRGYRVNVHDLTGTVVNDRQDVDSLIASKRAADKAFHAACLETDANARDILAKAIERETRKHARALTELKIARKALAKVKP